MLTLSQFRRLSNDALANKAVIMAGVISGSPTTYGLNIGQATAMSDAADVFTANNSDVALALMNLESLRINLDQSRQDLIDTYTSLLKLSYADPAVTDVNLGSLGLAPRNTSRSTVVPVQPIDLVATPRVDGNVKLAWGTNGNKYGVVYEVQAGSTDSTEWVGVSSTTRKSVIVGGFTPGVIRWFRVRATKNGVASDWSLTEGIYLPTNGETFTLAQAA